MGLERFRQSRSGGGRLISAHAQEANPLAVCIKSQIQNLNLVIGCTIGCTYCYARSNVRRFRMIEDFEKPEYSEDLAQTIAEYLVPDPDAQNPLTNTLRLDVGTLQAMEQIPPEQRQALAGVLAQDPRPSYQEDPERGYGMKFAGYEVGFTVADGVLTVCRIRPVRPGQEG